MNSTEIKQKKKIREILSVKAGKKEKAIFNNLL
jgi:hypothetical protein